MIPLCIILSIPISIGFYNSTIIAESINILNIFIYIISRITYISYFRNVSIIIRIYISRNKPESRISQSPDPEIILTGCYVKLIHISIDIFCIGRIALPIPTNNFQAVTSNSNNLIVKLTIIFYTNIEFSIFHIHFARFHLPYFYVISILGFLVIYFGNNFLQYSAERFIIPTYNSIYMGKDRCPSSSIRVIKSSYSHSIYL